MKYTLYINLSDPSSIYREAECNKGIDQVPALLDEIRRRGEVVQIRNAAEMSKEELLTAYFTDAAVAAVYGKYRVRTVFGSNRQPGVVIRKRRASTLCSRFGCQHGAQCLSPQYVGSIRHDL